MATRILDLFRDGDCFQTLSQNARKRAVECFDTQKIIPQYEAFYQEVLETE